MRLTSTESETQKAIMDYLAARRIFALRLNTGTFQNGKRFIRAHSAGAGAADILAFPTVAREFYFELEFIIPLWIEVKSAKGKQSAEQKSFQQKVLSEGHLYCLARSVEDVDRVLGQMGGKSF